MRAANHRAPLAALAVIVASLGCGGSSAGPRETLKAYREALVAGDHQAAHELLSAKLRARYSEAELARLMEDSPREVKETAERLAAPPRSVAISAQLTLGLGDRIELVKEDGGWKIASNPVAFYDQSTPRSAILSFVRAFRLQRWEVMLQFVPGKYRPRMTVEKMRKQFERKPVAKLMTLIQANLAAPIAEKGDEARMAYGNAHEVVLIREDGRWKVQDLDATD